MKQIAVRLNYASMSQGPEGVSATPTFPVRLLDTEGAVLAEGAASVDQPAVLQADDRQEQVFVRLTWPSGRSETRRLSLRDGEEPFSVEFSDSRIAANEWSAWAIPKLNPQTPLLRHGSRLHLDLELARFDRVWLRLWKFAGGHWTPQPLQPQATYRNDTAWQLDLELDAAVWLLQLGGSKVIWRFVSLPGGGPARVLITPRDSDDPRADALKVIVTSHRGEAETLLEFLARDALRSAKALAGSAALAQQLFAAKLADPVSAVAGAYYLLRADPPHNQPLDWYENLYREFRWLPDAAIVYCTRLLREGLRDAAARRTVRKLFGECLERGWPVFGEGVSLLQENAALLRGSGKRAENPDYARVMALGAARAWAGAAASFYGRHPGEPSALQWVGMPGAPRRHRLDPALRYPATPPGRPVQAREKTSPYATAPAPATNVDRSRNAAETVAAAPAADEVFLLGSIPR